MQYDWISTCTWAEMRGEGGGEERGGVSKRGIVSLLSVVHVGRG